MTTYIEIQYTEDGNTETISPFVQMCAAEDGILVYNGWEEYLIKTEDLHTIKFNKIEKDE